MTQPFWYIFSIYLLLPDTPHALHTNIILISFFIIIFYWTVYVCTRVYIRIYCVYRCHNIYMKRFPIVSAKLKIEERLRFNFIPCLLFYL